MPVGVAGSPPVLVGVAGVEEGAFPPAWGGRGLEACLFVVVVVVPQYFVGGHFRIFSETGRPN